MQVLRKPTPVPVADRAQQELGDRTTVLLALLAERGPQLEKYNDFRDKFIEHVHPLRETRQPRPASGQSALGFHEPTDGQCPPIDRILGSGPGWVRMEAISSSGRTYRVVRAHVILVGDARGPSRIELDPTMTGESVIRYVRDLIQACSAR